MNALRSRLSVEFLEDRAVPAKAGGGVTNPNPVGYTPAQIRHAYGFDQIPSLAANYNATAGAGQTIAVVMAGDHPSIASDLHVFSQTFGLPDPPSFVKLTQTGSTTGPWPAVNADWAGEIAMDVEWAHAIAPQAQIVLVEAKSANLSDLVAAIDTARRYPNVGVVSMSWGLLEGSIELQYDTSLLVTPPTQPGQTPHTPVTFVAATLDNGTAPFGYTYWPAASPNVIGVGGTTLTALDAAGDYAGETAWAASTGGLSPYEGQPAYQQGFVKQSATRRGIPDVSYHADNSNGHGFAVYSTVAINRQTGWFNAYGDSAGAPQWAGLVALANQQRGTAGTLDGRAQTLPGLYNLATQNYSQYFHDITTGGNRAYPATAGYDLVTGLGTPRADQLVAGLAGLSATGVPALAPTSIAATSSGGTANTGGGLDPAPALPPNKGNAATTTDVQFAAPDDGDAPDALTGRRKK